MKGKDNWTHDICGWRQRGAVCISIGKGETMIFTMNVNNGRVQEEEPKP